MTGKSGSSAAIHPWHRVMRAFLAMPKVELKSRERWGLQVIGLGEMLDLYDEVKRTQRAPPARSNRAARGGAGVLPGPGSNRTARGGAEALTRTGFGPAEQNDMEGVRRQSTVGADVASLHHAHPIPETSLTNDA